MSNENYLENYPKMVFINETETLLRQMKNNVCQVCTKGTNGTGFFCKIPLAEGNYMPVFITSNHVINADYLRKEKNIIIQMNDGKKNNIKSINLKDRIIFTSVKYDITIVEIEQKIDHINDFLELDENILKDPICYVGNTVYLLHYPGFDALDKVAVSFGIIKEINKDHQYNFNHYCSTTYGSSGSPILNLSNNKIIGIHNSTSKEQFNLGSFLNRSLSVFIDEYSKARHKKNIFHLYKCTNKNNLKSRILTGTNTTKIVLNLKNNGRMNWPENTTKLIFDKKSEVIGDEIILKPQKIGEELKYDIEFNNLRKLQPGEYKSYLYFKINDRLIGEQLTLKIKVINKENYDEDIKMEKIKEFRENFALSEDEFSNDKLYNILENCEFDLEEAFSQLFE